jgi:exopolyphosphatase/guanosine-5'-triphosphate,3'-diphosphate pyrophosphatase
MEITMDRVFAALDLGTNSTLLLTAVERDGRLEEVLTLTRTTRLGEGLGVSGRLLPEAATRTLEAVREFLGQLPPASSGVLVAAGTSALRDALNPELFLAPFAAAYGREPYIFSGREEAETTFLGAASDQPPGQFVVTLDIGGGSTEIGAGYSGDHQLATSLNLGCVRFGERFGLYELPDASALAQARAAAADLLAPVCRQIRELRPSEQPLQVVASGGTASTFAAMKLRQVEFRRELLHGLTGSESEVAAALLTLFAQSSRERALIPGISPGRAAVFPTGLLILDEALRQLGAPEFTVSTRGVRYGLLLRLQSGDLKPTWSW